MSLISSLAESTGMSVAVAEDLLKPEALAWDQQPKRQEWERILRERLPGKIEREGLSPTGAALELGLTEDSFQAILERRPPHFLVQRGTQGEPRFLKEDLDAFRDAYLPRFQTWGDRLSLFREFAATLQARTGLRLEPQFCESLGCGRLAWEECANSTCRADQTPRKVCGVHSEAILEDSGKRLCADCVRRALFGDLRDTYEVAGTRSRLEQEYKNG